MSFSNMGDDEGGSESVQDSIPDHKDPHADDDVEIVLRLSSDVEVDYRLSQSRRILKRRFGLGTEFRL